VWISIRRKLGNPSSSRLHLVAASDGEYTCGDHRIFFEPTAKFVRWMKAQFSGKLIYDIGAGTGHVSKALATAGLHVIALDLAPRIASLSEFEVLRADSTQHQFEKGSVVLICRPSHSGFVEKTIAKAIHSHVAAIVYVGLTKNLQDDLGSIHDWFTKRRVGVVGQAGEGIWVLDVKRLRAEASLRRSIPQLSSEVVR
jgi:SAM-dependent methyltransferase